MRGAWVDFTDVHDGRTTILHNSLEAGVVIDVGRQLTVGDHDGSATIVGITGLHVELAI